MNMTADHWLIIAGILVCLDILVICRLIIGRLKKENNYKEQKDFNEYFYKAADGTGENIHRKTDISKYVVLNKAVKLDRLRKESLDKYFDIHKAEQRYLRRLTSHSKTKRSEAALYLSALGTDRARFVLEASLPKEKSITVKLSIANALSDIGNAESLPVLVDSLIASKRFYRDKVNMLITDFGEKFHSYLPKIIGSSRIEIKELIVDFSSIYFSEKLKNYLIDMVSSMDQEIQRLEALYGNDGRPACRNCRNGSYLPGNDRMECRYYKQVSPSHHCRRYQLLQVSVNLADSYRKLVYKACNILADYYPRVLNNDNYLKSKDDEIKNIAVRALANFYEDGNMIKLLVFLREEDTSRSAANAISLMIEKNPVYLNLVVKNFIQEQDSSIKKELAKILSIRVEYFITKLANKDRKDAGQIIREILLSGRSSEIIGFLNKNNDIDTENELIAILKSIIPHNSRLADQCTKFLDERLLTKCGLKPYAETPTEKQAVRDKKLIAILVILLIMSIGIFPVIYFLRYKDVIFGWNLIESLKLYVYEFTYSFAFYAMMVNLIYIILLIFSYIEAKKQEKMWKIKNKSMLFKKNMLPSISIIAPAYNEEKTIIESANSLLNLQYPNYELILVNDGSKDHTLQTLIKYFDLKRVDYIYKSKLGTKPIRGVYLNRSRPKLIVVDKENGGKADALNVGINISSNEYICGIDSDSLLEDEALLKLASLTLDEETETPALGGNILPINGCIVERGQMKEIHIPHSKLARFQTMEYIRAFMSGRLGWAKMNGLLIISGAFGLFRKERIINIGGYLTSSGKYKKDTVGEDMELVVRISRQMREAKQKYRICYSFNANCWTEVPEDLKTLKKQRYRWHRGLIEILAFHRKMLFNPKYGRTGTIAMPYFYLFEMIGPLFEIQGLLAVILAFILGVFNFKIVVILFVAVILMGVLISVSSLLIAEKNNRYFSSKELAILIGYSIIENFGIKQYFSLWRVGGYLNMLKRPKGWEKAERKGFSSAKVKDDNATM